MYPSPQPSERRTKHHIRRALHAGPLCQTSCVYLCCALLHEGFVGGWGVSLIWKSFRFVLFVRDCLRTGWLHSGDRSQKGPLAFFFSPHAVSSFSFSLLPTPKTSIQL